MFRELEQSAHSVDSSNDKAFTHNQPTTKLYSALGGTG